MLAQMLTIRLGQLVGHHLNPKTGNAATEVLVSKVPSPSTAPQVRELPKAPTDGLSAEVTFHCGVFTVTNKHLLSKSCSE